MIFGGSFITQALDGAITRDNTTTDVGSRRGRGRNYHIGGVLPQDSEVGGLTSDGMYINRPHCRSDVAIFHVKKFSLEGCSAAGGEGAAAPLQYVRNAYAGGADDQASEDSALFQEY